LSTLRANRFAWNFQGRCGVTMGRPNSIFGHSRETARCRDAQHGDGVCCAFAPQLVLSSLLHPWIVVNKAPCVLLYSWPCSGSKWLWELCLTRLRAERYAPPTSNLATSMDRSSGSSVCLLLARVIWVTGLMTFDLDLSKVSSLRNHRWGGSVYVLQMFFVFFLFLSVRQKYETTVLGHGWTDFHETFTKR